MTSDTPTTEPPNIIGDIHWRACEECMLLLPQGGCRIPDDRLKLSLDLTGPELRCASFRKRRTP